MIAKNPPKNNKKSVYFLKSVNRNSFSVNISIQGERVNEQLI